MLTTIRRKAATIVLLFLDLGVTTLQMEWFSDAVAINEDEKVTLTIKREKKGVVCDPDSAS